MQNVPVYKVVLRARNNTTKSAQTTPPRNGRAPAVSIFIFKKYSNISISKILIALKYAWLLLKRKNMPRGLFLNNNLWCMLEPAIDHHCIQQKCNKENCFWNVTYPVWTSFNYLCKMTYITVINKMWRNYLPRVNGMFHYVYPSFERRLQCQTIDDNNIPSRKFMNNSNKMYGSWLMTTNTKLTRIGNSDHWSAASLSRIAVLRT